MGLIQVYLAAALEYLAAILEYFAAILTLRFVPPPRSLSGSGALLNLVGHELGLVTSSGDFNIREVLQALANSPFSHRVHAYTLSLLRQVMAISGVCSCYKLFTMLKIVH